MKNFTLKIFVVALLISFQKICYSQFGASPWTAPSGTYTVPAGVTQITVTCYGGGGAGGGATTTDRNGGGGGGGACVTVTNYAVTPGQQITVAVGAGGTGVSAGTGNIGGPSSVNIVGFPIFVSAAGGVGGTMGANSSSAGAGGSGGLIANNIPINTGFKGGNGGNSDPVTTTNDRSGGGGGGAGTTAAGSNGAIVTAGAGGATGGGAGGVGISTTGSTGGAGTAGNTYGGAGGGSTVYSSGSRAGAAGAAGGVIITYTQVCSAPTTQASAVTFSSVTDNSMTVSWTRGSTPGDAVIVLIHTGAAVDANPVDLTAYTACATSPSCGTQIGTGNYVVFLASGTSVNMTGLTQGTVYYYSVYEMNCIGTSSKYYTTAPATGFAATLGLVIYNVSSTWTVPLNVTSATFYLKGGGGGGGGAVPSSCSCAGNGAGGGGGANGTVTVSGLVSGDIYTITRGAAGTAGAAANGAGGNGGTGGTTTIARSSGTGPAGPWTTIGGGGGSGANTACSTAPAGGTAGNSGTGAGIIIINGGAGFNANEGSSSSSCTGCYTGPGGGGAGSGGAGGTVGSCSTVAGGAGGTGTYPGGAGAKASSCTAGDLAGIAGTAPGGGGSGCAGWSSGGLTGGAGAVGQVVVTYTIMLTPNFANINTPANGGTNLCPTTTTLNWTANGVPAPTGYRVYFGTDAAATNIQNGLDVFNVLTWNPGALLNNQLYYWKIVPYNGHL